MIKLKNLLHTISYIQYPVVLLGVFYAYKPLLFSFESIWDDYNKALIFLGLSISFSTLQDTTKTQNKISKRVWRSPKYSKIFLTYIIVMIVVFLSLGMLSLFLIKNPNVQSLSFGFIAIGIGLISLLRSGMEMAEHNQKEIPASE